MRLYTRDRKARQLTQIVSIASGDKEEEDSPVNLAGTPWRKKCTLVPANQTRNYDFVPGAHPKSQSRATSVDSKMSKSPPPQTRSRAPVNLRPSAEGGRRLQAQRATPRPKYRPKASKMIPTTPRKDSP